MKTPFFSIGIPVYNAEKYLNGCIDSILSQSFTDFELILVDDGSTDNSLSICRSYAEKDSRVKVFHYENGGISVASNHILDECIGEYVFLMDNDDTMCENTLQNAYNAIVENDYPDLVRTYYNLIENGSKREKIQHTPGEEYDGLTQDERVIYILENGIAQDMMWIKFINSNIIFENNLRFEVKYTGVQDTDFNIKVLRKCKRIVFAKFPSVNWYHPREGRVSTKYNLKTALIGMNLCNDYADSSNTWNMSDTYKQKAENLFLGWARLRSEIGFYMSKDDIKIFAKEVDKIFGKRFRVLPEIKEFKGKIFKLYNIIGIKNTLLIYNFYARLRGYTD